MGPVICWEATPLVNQVLAGVKRPVVYQQFLMPVKPCVTGATPSFLRHLLCSFLLPPRHDHWAVQAHACNYSK